MAKKILVTGSKGFIGKNLVARLSYLGYTPLSFDLGQSEEELAFFVKESDFIVHLAGINRPLTTEEFYDGNVNFTKKLLDLVEAEGRKTPLLFSSSTQAEKDNDYGKSKRMAEEQIREFSLRNKSDAYIYRFYNVYGKWCRPSYNSVIATWCYNISHDIPIEINEAAPPIDFVYIDDVVDNIISCIEGKVSPTFDIIYAEPHDKRTLKNIAELLYSFKNGRKSLELPLQSGFEKKLYATYLSYVEEFSYPLEMHIDNRGSFTEMLHIPNYGQVSVNIGHPGITKGNHYHNTKNEKYIVVEGNCVTKLRRIDSEEVIEIYTSGEKMEVIDIPPGYTHSITTLGNKDSVTIMWANEPFDKEHPDTISMPVEIEK